MKQSEFNKVLVAVASSIVELPPAFNSMYFGAANVTYREYLCCEQMQALEKMATEYNIKRKRYDPPLLFSRRKFVNSCLKDSTALTKKMIIGITVHYEEFNGILTKIGVDPYKEGTVKTTNQRIADTVDSCRFAAGLVQQDQK